MLEATRSLRTGRSRRAWQSTAVPELVRRRVLGQLVHALPDADARGEVDDRVGAVERAAHGLGVADVADHELHLRAQVVRPRPALVHLLGEVVERPHAVPAGEQRVGEVRADEARAAGDQDELSHPRRE